jgi:hypothetical protein
MAPPAEFVRSAQGEIREFITAGGTINLDGMMAKLPERS